MNVSGIYLVALLCAALLVSGVSAQNIEKDPGYTITPVNDLNLPDVIQPKTIGTITQGETDWHYYTVTTGTSVLTADLNWGNPSNSLSLTIIAPDGTIGPYYDSADGVLDGRVTLRISRTGGLTTGLWKFKVFGNSVSGTQAYNFLTN
jgi:hypothetical protein